MDENDDHLRDNEEEVTDDSDINTSQTDDSTSFLDDGDHEDTEPSQTEQIEYNRKLDEYLDYYDRQTSKQMKTDLRALFKQSSSLLDVYAGEEEEKVPEPPPLLPVPVTANNQILEDNDIVDWRAELVYRAEWENYKKNVHEPDNDLMNGRKRRRIE